jgi:hypothetical protein
VSRVRNADEFRTVFQRASGDYDRIFRRRLDEARAWYDQLPAERRPPEFDESLEHHARSYLINALLAGLNWRLDLSLDEGLPNLLPEVGVRSEISGRRRFLDYLGIEHATNLPLLIVEAKRPSSPLAVLTTLPDIPTTGPQTSALHGAIPVTETNSVVISRGLAGEPLSGDWTQWLRDLRDYVRSVKVATGQVPKRVVITNGRWLILFLRPAEAFIDERGCDPGTILVFHTPEQILEESGLLFSKLEHQGVLGEAPTLRPVELPFYVEPRQIQEAMHGLRLRYEQAQAIYQREPMIYVAPVVFLRTDLGAWLRVEASAVQYSIPHEPDHLEVHLEAVRTAGRSLLAEVNSALQIDLSPSPLEKHFADPDSFEAQNAVIKLLEDQYWIVTGEQTHYLMAEPSVAGCPHHDYANSHNLGVAAVPGPILQRSVETRSFFYSREAHHCAHQNVALAKSQQVTPENRERCGPRSGRDGEAFCEIWSFERRLCCRTCVFERVCTKAQTFRLPCERLVQVQNAMVVVPEAASAE